MEIKTEIKIKINGNKEIVLNDVEAEELYYHLKKLFDNDISYIPWYPDYTT